MKVVKVVKVVKDVKDTPVYVPPTDEDMRIIIDEMKKSLTKEIKP